MSYQLYSMAFAISDLTICSLYLRPPIWTNTCALTFLLLVDCPGQYTCRYNDYPNECIDNSRLCDGVNDCLDSQDEENCGGKHKIR